MTIAEVLLSVLDDHKESEKLAGKKSIHQMILDVQDLSQQSSDHSDAFTDLVQDKSTQTDN